MGRRRRQRGGAGDGVEGRRRPLLLGPTPPHLAGTGAKEGARGGVGGGDRRPVRRCRCLSLHLSGGGGCGGPPGGGGGGGEEAASAVCVCVCARFEGGTA